MSTESRSALGSKLSLNAAASSLALRNVPSPLPFFGRGPPMANGLSAGCEAPDDAAAAAAAAAAGRPGELVRGGGPDATPGDGIENGPGAGRAGGIGVATSGVTAGPSLNLDSGSRSSALKPPSAGMMMS